MSDFEFDVDEYRRWKGEASSQASLDTSSLPPQKSGLDIKEVLEYIRIINDKDRYAGFRKWFTPGTLYGIDKLPKHSEFFKAGLSYHERYLSAANRFGKSVAGSFEAACHATGMYHDWWEGRRFDHPTSGWAVGQTSITTRDILQKELMGEPGNVGTGMLPPELIVGTSAKSGVPGAIDTIQVRHVSGGVSTISFKSYDQGIKAFFGTAKHWIWCDELPPEDIYNECYVRTMTTNGITFITATPLEGLTPLVLNFYINADFLPKGNELPGLVKLAREDEDRNISDKIAKGEITKEEAEKAKQKGRDKAVIIGGWDDAPWLSDEVKKRLLEATPVHLREARSRGLPSMGSGAIFPIPLDEIVVNDFPIPSHFRQIYGMDVGWSATAAAKLALDPDTDTVYLCAEYKRGNAEPLVHAAAIKRWGEWLPGKIDPASMGRSQVDGRRLFQMYRELGLKVSPADNAVEAGIYNMYERLSTGKLKVFKSCVEFQKEYITYRRDDKGRVIKENDHIIDSVRYGLQHIHEGKPKPVSQGNRLQGGKYGGGRNYGV